MDMEKGTMYKKVKKMSYALILAALLAVSFTACQADNRQGRQTGMNAANQSAGQSADQSAGQAADQTGNQSGNLSGNQSGNQSVNQAEKQVAGQSANQAEKTTEHQHTYHEEQVPGSCVAYPKTVYTCTGCGDTYEEIHEEAGYSGHQYEERRTQATCTEAAKIIYTCSVCKDSYSVDDENNPALGHESVFQSVVVTATDTSPGVKRFACKRCGEYSDVNYALPHKVNAYNGTQIVYGYWDKECEKEIASILDEYRKANGLRPFMSYSELSQTARTRAMEIAYSYRHNHSRPTNASWRTAYNSNLGTCGENIAAGQEDAQAVMYAWKNSSSHNENMLDPDFDSVGIGVFVRVDCVESGEVTVPDPEGLSYNDRYYVQSFSD